MRLPSPKVTRKIQVALGFGVGLPGMVAALFLPTDIAVKVINEVSMLTLFVAGLAGADATRPSEKE